GRARRDHQFERALVGVYGDAVELLQLGGDGAAQAVCAFKKAVMVETFADDVFGGLLKLRVQADFVLSLHEIAARGHESRNRADVGLWALCSCLQIKPPLNRFLDGW